MNNKLFIEGITSHLDRLITEGQSICLLNELFIKPIKYIARGAEGAVYMIDMNNVRMAAKFSITLFNTAQNRELRILQQLENEFVVKVYQISEYVFPLSFDQMPESNQLSVGVVIMELAKCNLFTYSLKVLRPMGVDNRIQLSLQIIKQVSLGMLYLMTNKILHRDLKPENILYFQESKCFKISDFGFSKVRDDDSQNTLGQGTIFYCDPFITTNSGYSNYSIECDIFSLGVILYLLVEGRFPWKMTQIVDQNDGEAKNNYKKYNVLPFQNSIGAQGDQLLKLCKNMMSSNTDNRLIGFMNILRILQVDSNIVRKVFPYFE